MTDEPVGYLGGAEGGEDPYGDTDDASLATENPHADAEEEMYSLPPASGPVESQVAGFLGGSTDAEIPGLPPAEEDDAAYSHRDFMEEDGGGHEDNYIGGYEDPYQMPADDGYDDYGGYEAAAATDTDPSYFDSMGHDDDVETGMATQTEVGYDTEEFADDDQPKTISQQDAESIIRRITTKRILPPEQQEGKQLSRPQPLTPAGGGLRIWPILLVALLLGGGAVYVFRKPIAKLIPALKPWLDPDTGPKGPVSGPAKTDPELVNKKKLLRMVMLSESKAFGIDMKDLEKADQKTSGKVEVSKTAKTEGPK